MNKIREALTANLDALCSLDKNQFGDVIIDGIPCYPVMVELVGKTREAIAEIDRIESEKPGEDIHDMYSPESLVHDIRNKKLYGNGGFALSEKLCAKAIDSYAEMYHQSRMKEKKEV